VADQGAVAISDARPTSSSISCARTSRSGRRVVKSRREVRPVNELSQRVAALGWCRRRRAKPYRRSRAAFGAVGAMLDKFQGRESHASFRDPPMSQVADLTVSMRKAIPSGTSADLGTVAHRHRGARGRDLPDVSNESLCARRCSRRARSIRPGPRALHCGHPLRKVARPARHSHTGRGKSELCGSFPERRVRDEGDGAVAKPDRLHQPRPSSPLPARGSCRASARRDSTGYGVHRPLSPRAGGTSRRPRGQIRGGPRGGIVAPPANPGLLSAGYGQSAQGDHADGPRLPRMSSSSAHEYELRHGCVRRTRNLADLRRATPRARAASTVASTAVTGAVAAVAASYPIDAATPCSCADVCAEGSARYGLGGRLLRASLAFARGRACGPRRARDRVGAEGPMRSTPALASSPRTRAPSPHRWRPAFRARSLA